MGCMCDFPGECSGTEHLHCDGCGGDLCICRCGGEQPCYGCEQCEPDGDAQAEGDDFTDEESE